MSRDGKTRKSHAIFVRYRPFGLFEREWARFRPVSFSSAGWGR